MPRSYTWYVSVIHNDPINAFFVFWYTVQDVVPRMGHYTRAFTLVAKCRKSPVTIYVSPYTKFYCIPTLFWTFLITSNNSFYYGTHLEWNIKYKSIQRNIGHFSERIPQIQPWCQKWKGFQSNYIDEIIMILQTAQHFPCIHLDVWVMVEW